MCYRRERLPALVRITAFCYMVALVTAEHLNMAQDAVDDQYKDCRNKMLKKVVNSGLLAEELDGSKIFRDEWDIKKPCASQIPGGVKEHIEALMVYGYGSGEFKKAFDQAVKTMGGNASVYDSNFKFKSLHFLLSDSMSLLRKSSECLTAYSVTKGNNTATVGSQVRLGRFTTATSDEKEILEDPELDKGTLLKIYSCYILNMRKLCGLEGNEILLSPAEVFTVDGVRYIGNDDYEYTEISLIHSTYSSNHDCFLFSKSPVDPSTQLLGTIMAVQMTVLLCLFMY